MKVKIKGVNKRGPIAYMVEFTANQKNIKFPYIAETDANGCVAFGNSTIHLSNLNFVKVN